MCTYKTREAAFAQTPTLVKLAGENSNKVIGNVGDARSGVQANWCSVDTVAKYPNYKGKGSDGVCVSSIGNLYFSVSTGVSWFIWSSIVKE